jgi:hypothetical protein
MLARANRRDTDYVIGLNATNCHTGEALAREQITSGDKPHVLEALRLPSRRERCRTEAAALEVLFGNVAKHFPQDTVVQFIYLPLLHAQLALSRKDPAKAIEALQSAVPYELGSAGG